jgi:hypothetical protein
VTGLPAGRQLKRQDGRRRDSSRCSSSLRSTSLKTHRWQQEASSRRLRPFCPSIAPILIGQERSDLPVCPLRESGRFAIRAVPMTTGLLAARVSTVRLSQHLRFASL